MSNIDKRALREATEGVSHEEWEVLDNGDDEYQVIVSGSLERGATYRSYRPVANEISKQKIAAFIAAFSPATALALLDELDSANGYASAFEAEQWHYHGLAESEGERADKAEKALKAAEKRIADYHRALNNLAAVARRYLPDYDEHPDIQAADDLLESAAGIGKGA